MSKSIPSDKPSVAVLGCGYWGKNLVRHFSNFGALHMVCDTDPTCRATAAELSPNALVVNVLQDVLESEVSGVVIATLAETHFDLARRA